MKLRMMTAVSALALVLSASAFAAEPRGAGDLSAAPSAQQAAQDGSAPADEKMRSAADDIKAFFIDKDAPEGARLDPVLIRRDMTAHGMMGETVVNPQGEKIATVKDIIIDKNGKAILVVVSDGGVLGLGDKLAAFEYGRVVTQKPDGDIVMSLSQDMIDRAADFSYDPDDRAEAKVIPPSSFSVAEILDGKVLDPNGRKIASIENVYFRDADVSQVIVGFNKKLGLGGDLAALDYDDLSTVRKNREIDFKLSANHAAQFKNFKKSAD